MIKRALAVFLILFCATSLAEEEFLAPEQAFLISGSSSENGNLRIHWRIADGYYLYQNKFRFTSKSPGVELAVPHLPKAETKHDPLFGDVLIYRDNLAIEIPISQLDSNAKSVEIDARFQGCADAGLCYPPRTQTILIALTDAANAPPPVDLNLVEDLVSEGTASSASDSEIPAEDLTFTDDEAQDPLAALSDLGQSLGLEDDGILPVEKAFQFDAQVIDGNNVKLRWDIADATYLYRDKIKLSLVGEQVQIGNYDMPPAKIKHNSITPEGEIGDVAAYYHQIDLTLPLVRGDKAATQVELNAKFQGCADRGICYPPVNKTIQLDLPAVTQTSNITSAAQMPVDASQSNAEIDAKSNTSDSAEPISEQDQITQLLEGGNTLVIIGTFFVIGLLLAFTPCIFPMIPILSGIIAGQGHNITPRKAFVLSLVYVLAMAVTYTVAGIFAGMFGANLQTALQNPWVISIFALVFVALAFSMFGFYELQLPSSWQSRLTAISNRQKGGTLGGVAIMGFLSALIVGPCVAPPLAGALIYIGQSQDPILGGAALFAMSIGMGLPLIAIGTSAGKLLPRAGAWMDNVKAVFGVTMLAIAIYLLERLTPTYLPESFIVLLWGILLTVSSVYLGILRKLPDDASGWSRLWQGLGLVFLLYGAAFIFGAAAGSKDTVQPLSGLFSASHGGSTRAEAHLQFERIKSKADLAKRLAEAKAIGQPVMLDFYADWCVYCKQMERDTFPDTAVQQALSGVLLLQADVTKQDDADTELQSHVGIPAPPAILFWDNTGKEKRAYRLLGYKGPAEFKTHVEKALK